MNDILFLENKLVLVTQFILIFQVMIFQYAKCLSVEGVC